MVLLCTGGQGYTNSTTDATTYDCDTDSWHQVAPTNHEHSYTSAVTWNGTVVVAGGEDPITDSVEQFNPQTNTWTALPNLLVARARHSLVNMDGSLYVIGGWDGAQAIGSVEQYTAESNCWTSLTSLNTARQGLACAVCQVSVRVLFSSKTL